jgi:hypothetical protein
MFDSLIQENFFEVVLSPTQVNLIYKSNNVNINKKNGTRQTIAVSLEKSKTL